MQLCSRLPQAASSSVERGTTIRSLFPTSQRSRPERAIGRGSAPLARVEGAAAVGASNALVRRSSRGLRRGRALAARAVPDGASVPAGSTRAATSPGERRCCETGEERPRAPRDCGSGSIGSRLRHWFLRSSRRCAGRAGRRSSTLPVARRMSASSCSPSGRSAASVRRRSARAEAMRPTSCRPAAISDTVGHASGG